MTEIANLTWDYSLLVGVTLTNVMAYADIASRHEATAASICIACSQWPYWHDLKHEENFCILLDEF